MLLTIDTHRHNLTEDVKRKVVKKKDKIIEALKV
jgi:hypothetical protein